METSIVLLFLPLFSLLLQLSHSKSVLVDGVAEWRNPNVLVGDTIIFKHKNHFNLYIFQNKRAFTLCNFTQATLLTNPSCNSYTWHPSRPGFFYFTFNDGTLKACDEIEKISFKVTARQSERNSPWPQISPEAAPTPESGGVVSSSPASHWHFISPQASSPSPFPTILKTPATVPPILPDTGGAIPFINSNPAVPLPTGEADAATIRPIPTSGHAGQVVVGLLALARQIPLFMVWLVLY